MWTEHFHKRFVFFHMWLSISPHKTFSHVSFRCFYAISFIFSSRHVLEPRWHKQRGHLHQMRGCEFISFGCWESLMCARTEGRYGGEDVEGNANESSGPDWMKEMSRNQSKISATSTDNLIISSDSGGCNDVSVHTLHAADSRTNDKAFFFWIPLSSPRTADRFCPHRWHRLHGTQMAHGPMS